MTNQPNKTPLDFIAQAFWEDYTKGHSIDGGVAYEQQLRQLKLNGSIESLKQLDVFLMNVRKDIQNKVTQSGKILSAQKQKELILNDEAFRKLLMFIGFYSGKVLANIWKSQCQWYGTQELQKINPTYVVDGDFLQSIGVRYINEDKFSHLSSTQVAQIDNPWLFLPLESIIMRVFGGFDYQIYSVQGKPQVADGLYRAVMQRLPEKIVIQIKQKEQSAQAQVQLKPSNQTADSIMPSVSTNVSHSSNQSQTNQPSNVQSSSVQPNNTQLKSAQLNQQPSKATIQETPSNTIAKTMQKTTPAAVLGVSTATSAINSLNQSNSLHKGMSQSDKQAHITKENSIKTNKTYDELLADLEHISFPQSHGIEQYLQAKQVMQKFDAYVKSQKLPDSEIKFSDKQIETRQKALDLMKQAADLGNTSAMLHYASYLSTGKWITQNKAQGVSLIQTAANTKDPRAMRLLSKLHYQGEGVTQDTQLGQYWLKQAADNGHPEAKIVANQMVMSQLMIDERNHDISTDKRYLIWIGATLLIGLFIFIVL